MKSGNINIKYIKQQITCTSLISLLTLSSYVIDVSKLIETLAQQEKEARSKKCIMMMSAKIS